MNRGMYESIFMITGNTNLCMEHLGYSNITTTLGAGVDKQQENIQEPIPYHHHLQTHVPMTTRIFVCLFVFALCLRMPIKRITHIMQCCKYILESFEGRKKRVKCQSWLHHVNISCERKNTSWFFLFFFYAMFDAERGSHYC